MQCLIDQLQAWRNAFRRSDEFPEEERKEKPYEICPCCGKTSLQVQIMETVNGLENRSRKIAVSTCTSCGENWSNPIRG